MTKAIKLTEPHIADIELEHVRSVTKLELHIPPGRNVVELSGPPGAGKTSVLTAIGALILGKRWLESEAPIISHGAAKMRGTLRFRDGHSTVFELHADGSSVREVYGPDGGKIAAGPEDLARLTKPYCLRIADVFGAGKSGAERMKHLKRLMPALDTEEIDGRIKNAELRRTDANAAAKDAAARAAGPPPEEPEEGPMPSEISDADVRERIAAAGRARQQAFAAKQRAEIEAQAAEEVAHHRWGALELARGRIAELEAALYEARDQLPAHEWQFAAAEQDAAAKRTAADALPEPPSHDALTDELARVQDENAAIRARRARHEQLLRARREHADRVAAAEAAAQKARAAAEQLATLRAERAAQIAAADLPVPGLRLEGETLYLHETEVAGLSEAEYLLLCLEIAARLSGPLRLILADRTAGIPRPQWEEFLRLARELDVMVIAQRHDAPPDSAYQMAGGKLVSLPSADGDL